MNPSIQTDRRSTRSTLGSAPVVAVLFFAVAVGATGQDVTFSTVAGTPVPESSLVGVAAGPAGNLFVTDYGRHVVRRITPAGGASILAGGLGVAGGTDGTGGNARFNGPAGITAHASGILYVSEWLNHTVRRISPEGIVTLIAGVPGVAGSTDGPGATARFNSPNSLTLASDGALYVADTRNHCIRRISTDGTVTLHAGAAGASGSANGSRSNARFSFPAGIAADAQGNLFVADEGNHTIRRISTDGQVSTLAGQAGQLGSSDGAAAVARLNDPVGIAVNAAGHVFVGDRGNHLIREITPAGLVRTVGGQPGLAGHAEGTGTNALFNAPNGLAVDATGVLFVADAGNRRIRRGNWTPSAQPLFTVQPEPRTATLGGTAEFRVGVTGESVGYQWWFDTSPLSGAASPSLVLSQLQVAQAGRYWCVASNPFGSVTSRVARLTLVHPTRTNLIWIPPGAFAMGGSSAAESPIHSVQLTRGFWIDAYEVTQRDYESVTGSNPSRFSGQSSRPVDTVSWLDATQYCLLLTQREHAAGRLPSGHVYRLPTEAEWEYACRAGSTTTYSFGDDPGALGDYAWYAANSGYVPSLGIDAGGSTFPVGTKAPNAFGLHDMHGNVVEWCADWYAAYSQDPTVDPRGPSSGTRRVGRGGALNSQPAFCTSSYRLGNSPTVKAYGIGFRIVLSETHEGPDASPPLVVHPESRAGVPGSEVSMRAEPTGPGPFGYQWWRNGVALPGATNDALTLSPFAVADAGAYWSVVTANGLARTTAVTRITASLEEPAARPIAMTGWNRDVILEQGPLAKADPLGPADLYAWIEEGALEDPNGLPSSGRFVGAVAHSQVVFELQPYSTNNVLCLGAGAERSASLSLSEPGHFASLAIAGAASGGHPLFSSGGTGGLTLHFADGSSNTVPYLALDWATPPPAGIYSDLEARQCLRGLGRAYLAIGGPVRDALYGFGHGVGIYQSDVNLAELGLANRLLVRLEFSSPSPLPGESEPPAVGILAVSGVPANATVSPPRLLSEPAAVQGFAGHRTTLTVDSEGTPPLFYQWHRVQLGSGRDLPGATNAALILDHTPVGGAPIRTPGFYSVTVRNAAGATTSHSVPLTLHSLDILPGGNMAWTLSFPAAASGEARTSTDLKTWTRLESFTNATVVRFTRPSASAGAEFFRLWAPGSP